MRGNLRVQCRAAQGSALVVPHKLGFGWRGWSEEEPAVGDVVHALLSKPDCLWSRGSRSLSIDVAAQLGHQPNEHVEWGWFWRRIFAQHDFPNRLPFGRFEDRFAIQLWATASQTADVQRSPGNDQIDRHAIQHAVQVIAETFFDLTARLQDTTQHLDHPAHRVILNDQGDLRNIINRQAGDQQPFDWLVAARRIDLADQYDVHRHRRQLAIWTPRRTKRHSSRTDCDFGLARVAQLAPAARLAGHFRCSPTDC